MIDNSWGKEPFDLRLTVLRLIRNLPGILTVTVLCTLLFGGFYYVKNVVFRGQKTYSAKAEFFVEYTAENWGEVGTYINPMTWNTWITSDEFLGFVKKYLPKDFTGGQNLSEMLSAEVPSDLRLPVITAISADPREAQCVLEAVKSAMVEDFPGGIRDVDSIRVITTKGAQEVIPDVRPVRAFVLAAVLGGFFAVVLVLLKEIGEERIWLPATLSRRYGLRQPGIQDTPLFRENLRFFLEGKKKIALCPAQEEINPANAAEYLKKILTEETAGEKEEVLEFLPLPCPTLAPEAAEQLRAADGVLLIVGAGKKDCRYMEMILEFLRQQEVSVTAALLWEQDRWLLKNYYRLEKQ